LVRHGFDCCHDVFSLCDRGDTLRGNPQAHPELLVWFPNVLFIVLGALLFRRLVGNKSAIG
jgi:hypothetical protein